MSEQNGPNFKSPITFLGIYRAEAGYLEKKSLYGLVKKAFSSFSHCPFKKKKKVYLSHHF